MLKQRISQTLQMDTIMTWVKILITSQKISLFPPCQLLMDIQRILALILRGNLSPKFPRVMMLLAIVINWKVHVKVLYPFLASLVPQRSQFLCGNGLGLVKSKVPVWPDLPEGEKMLTQIWCNAPVMHNCEMLSDTCWVSSFFSKKKIYFIVLGIELIRCVPFILNKEIEKKSSKCQVWPHLAPGQEILTQSAHLPIVLDRIGPMIVTLIMVMNQSSSLPANNFAAALYQV